MLKHVQMREAERDKLFTRISNEIRSRHEDGQLEPGRDMLNHARKTACACYWMLNIFGAVNPDWYQSALTGDEEPFENTPFFAEDLKRLNNAFEYTSEDPDKADEILLKILMPARITAFQEELLIILNLSTE